jgi:hypothetical protein
MARAVDTNSHTVRMDDTVVDTLEVVVVVEAEVAFADFLSCYQDWYSNLY